MLFFLPSVSQTTELTTLFARCYSPCCVISPDHWTVQWLREKGKKENDRASCYRGSYFSFHVHPLVPIPTPPFLDHVVVPTCYYRCIIFGAIVFPRSFSFFLPCRCFLFLPCLCFLFLALSIFLFLAMWTFFFLPCRQQIIGTGLCSHS